MRRNRPQGRTGCRLSALGMVNALGAGTEEIWPRLLAGDQSRLRARADLSPNASVIVGEVTSPLPAIPPRLARYDCRNNALTLAALQQIEPQIVDAIRLWGPDRIGVVAGTSTSGVASAEEAIFRRAETGELVPGFDYRQLEFGSTARFIADCMKVTGPSYSISTACSSGAHALASARSLLECDWCDAVIAAATDSLCRLTVQGFEALHTISSEVTNPCSVNRKGINLGEGSALFLVTREQGGIQLLGVGESTDAYQMSAPDPEGRGVEIAMREALRDAEVEPQEISYVCLHGTGTPLNDRMEMEAVARVVGPEVPCSSIKPMIGHTLGAAGAMSAGICWSMLDKMSARGLPLVPHCWDGARDPALPATRLVTKNECCHPQRRALVMSNAFGFGGNNCTVVLGTATG